MKAIYKHIAFAALALSVVACSQDDDFAPSYLSDPDAVRITAQVGTAYVTGGFTRSNPLGTAEEQAKFNTGDQISVTAGTQAPVTYQLGTDGWKPVGEAYLKWQTNEMNVTAYYPVGKNNASATTFTVPQTYADLAAIAEADYMTYNGTQTKGDDKSIDLTMQRKMVRLVITPEFNDQFATGYSVTTIKVHANTKGYADGQPETGDITVTALKQGDAFYALLAPTTADADATFLTVTVSDGTTLQELTVKGIPTTTAGNSYSFALTVGKDMVAMGTVSVKDWTGATIEGGVAVEEDYNYNESTNTYIVRTTDALNTAISNAGTSGTTDNPAIIKLTADVEIAGTPDESGTYEPALLVDKGVIALDLNGRTITFTDKPFYAIRVNNGATLTINDSSERKQGKIANAKYVLDLRDGKLVINGGTFEGEYAVEGWDENSIIEINGGTFIATKDAVYAQNSFLTITGGTFTGDRYALSLNSSGIFSFIGGSFYGKKYDVGTAGQVGFLSYNKETGTGPTFPGGLSIYTTEYLGFNLNALLAEGAAYYDADGAKIELDDSAASYNGDVTVKKVTE